MALRDSKRPGEMSSYDICLGDVAEKSLEIACRSTSKGRIVALVQLSGR